MLVSGASCAGACPVTSFVDEQSVYFVAGAGLGAPMHSYDADQIMPMPAKWLIVNQNW